jgi:hypothetical protein
MSLMPMLPPRSGGNTCPKPNAGKSGAMRRIHYRSQRAFAFTAMPVFSLKTQNNAAHGLGIIFCGLLCFLWQ